MFFFIGFNNNTISFLFPCPSCDFHQNNGKKKGIGIFFSTGHTPWYIIVAISLCWLVLVIGFNNNSIWSIFESSSSCKTNFYCEPLKHVLFRKRDMRSTLTQSVILKLNLCNKTTVKWYNKRIYVIPLVDKKTEFLLRWKILIPNYSTDWGWRIH